MLPVLWITSLFSVMLIQPWSVNNPTDEIKINNQFVFNPADLEFLKYENEPLFVWKDTIVCVLALVLFLLAWWKWKQLILEKDDLEKLFRRSDSLPLVNREISGYYDDTSKLFKELEMRLQILNKRYKKIEKDVEWDDKVYGKQKDDCEFLTESWNGQYATFGLVDIDPEAGSSDWATRMDLFDVQEKFDADIAEIDEFLTNVVGVN